MLKPIIDANGNTLYLDDTCINLIGTSADNNYRVVCCNDQVQGIMTTLSTDDILKGLGETRDKGNSNFVTFTGIIRGEEIVMKKSSITGIVLDNLGNTCVCRGGQIQGLQVIHSIEEVVKMLKISSLVSV